MRRRRNKTPHPIIDALKAERQRRGLVVKVIADQIGMTAVGLRALERYAARPSFETLVAWAEVLEMELTLRPKEAA